MSTRIRTGLAAAGFLLAMGIAGSALAVDNSSIFGRVIAEPAGTPVSGARVDAVGVVDFAGRPVFDITLDSIFFYFLFPVPSGEQLLRVSGNCLETTDVPVTVPPDGLEQDLSAVNRSLPGVGDCLPVAHTPLFFDTFWEQQVLNHRATLADGKPFSVSLPFAVKFDGKSYRRVWVASNGWISFNKPVAPCNQLNAANAPAASVFALAQCGETREVKYEVFGQKPQRVMVLRWKSLVTADTAEPSDVAIRFFEDQPANIGVSYVGLGGPKDGSNGFIGFSTKPGDVFTLGNHESVVQNESSLIFRTGL
jgi:hypothetical protein